jgi:hypothetical protein
MAMGERQPVRRRHRQKAEGKAKIERNNPDGSNFLNMTSTPCFHIFLFQPEPQPQPAC